VAQDYRDCSLDLAYLLPQAPRERLPEGHLALFLEDAVGLLDLSEITRRYRKGRGPRAYHPRMLLTLLLYGYCQGVYRSRKIAGGCETDVAFRVLSGDSSPTSGPWPISSRTTWQPFRGSLLKCWGYPGSGIGGPLRNYLKTRLPQCLPLLRSVD
jgi:transposase